MSSIYGKTKYIIVFAFTVALMCLLLCLEMVNNRLNIIPNWGFTDDEIAEYGEFWFWIPAAENKGLQADVSAVSDEDGVVFFVLPNTVDERNIVYYVRDGYNSEFEARRTVNLSSGEASVLGKKLRLIKSEIPVMYIETGSESISFYDFINSYDRDERCYARVCLTSYDSSGVPIYYESEKSNEDKKYDRSYLKPRGNQTWAGMHKKPFSLVLDKSENLLNMGKFKKWNLLADSQDKSLLKNYVFNNLAHDVGVEYEPEMEHILLYVNGSLQGVYLLTTKIGVGENKVKLSNDDFFIIWGGSNPEQIIPYEAKDWFGDTDDINYPYAELVYPENDTESGLREKQSIIQNYVSSIEDYTSNDYINYLDVDSMVKFYWIQEASMNTDACYRSTYSYYKNSTGKFYFAPIWDMDLTLGSNATKDGIEFLEPEGWKIREMGYFKALFNHPEFKESVEKAYWEDGIREKLYNVIEEYKSERERIRSLGVIDNKIWKDEIIENAFCYDAESYDINSEKTLEFYIKRLNWIDNEMSKIKENEEY